MDTSLDMNLLRTLHRSGVEHDAAQSDRLLRRRNLEPESAALLAVVLRAMGARRMVEIGTSNGYSAIWFADALRANGTEPRTGGLRTEGPRTEGPRTGGPHTAGLVSVDLDGAAQREAATHLAEAGLDGYVELREADGGAVLRELPDGGLDALFLDSERTEYAGWWPHPRRVLRPGGLLIVDNVLSHPDEVAEFLGLVEADAEFTSTTAAVGKGLHLAVRAAA